MSTFLNIIAGNHPAQRRRGRELLILLGFLLIGVALAFPLGASDNDTLTLILLGAACGVYLVIPLRRQLLIIVVIAIYFQPLENLQLPVSQSNIHLLDVFVAMAFVSWIVRWALRLHTLTLDRRAASLLLAIITLLLTPALVGLLQGNILITILRDMRVPFYYIALSLLTISSMRTHDDLFALLRDILLVTLPALAYYFISWALGIPTAEGASTVILSTGRYLRYGLVTSWEYILLAWLCGLAFLSASNMRPTWRPWLLAVTLACTVALMALLVRGIYLGMMGGFVTILLLSGWLRTPQRLISAALVMAALAGLIVAADAAAGTGLLRAVSERALSIVDPRASTSSSAANRATRLETTQIIGSAARGASNPLIGAGYGDRGVYAYSRNRELQALFRHSAYSWLFYRVGLLPGLLILALFGLIIWRSGRRLWQMPNSLPRACLVTVLAAFVANFFVGLGNNTIFDFFGAFSVQVVVALAVLSRFIVTQAPGTRDPDRAARQSFLIPNS